MQNILIESPDGRGFVRFGNEDGKAWVMPVRNMEVGMGIYQPSSWRGKLLKTFFPALSGFPFVCKLIKGENKRLALAPEIKDLLCRLLQVEDLEFAIFEGTPSIHQKVTMQFSLGKNILGYAKFTESSKIYDLFQHETNLLQHLENAGLKHIPKILYCGKTGDGFLMLQTTEKTISSSTPHSWDRRHEEFLSDLYARTANKRPFEETEYFKNISSFQKNIHWIDNPKQREVVEQAIDSLMDRYCGKRLDCHAVHGDFTPWNTCVTDNNLFVFDWEYGYLSCPFDLDRYHFYTQSSIFERHSDAPSIIGKAPEWVHPTNYSIYLLDVIARYMLREEGKISGHLKQIMHIWIQLLKHYFSK